MSLPYLIDIDGLVQNRRNSIAFAMELRLFCTNFLRLIYKWIYFNYIIYIVYI